MFAKKASSHHTVHLSIADRICQATDMYIVGTPAKQDNE